MGTVEGGKSDGMDAAGSSVPAGASQGLQKGGGLVNSLSIRTPSSWILQQRIR